MKKGKLFLVPTYLSASNDRNFLSPTIIEVVKNCHYFFVENVRTARRFLGSLKAGVVIDERHFFTLDKSTTWDDLYPLFDPIRQGRDMAVMSEAGLPCLADPGNLAVTFAHQTNIQVVPLPGASSIQMALIASGFNGQQFTFHGYLPIDKSARTKKIKELERMAQGGYTQLFMETPYRNNQLLNDIIKACRPDSLLSVASNITGSNESIKTMALAKWRDNRTDIHKIPSIFSFGQFP